MKSKDWKKLTAAVLAGGMLLLTAPALAAPDGISAEEVYNSAAVKDYNVAVPLSQGTFRSSIDFPGKLKVNFGYDFLMVRDDSFGKYRPEFTEAVESFSRNVRRQIVNSLERYEKLADSMQNPETTPYFSYESFGVRRADARVVSFLDCSSDYEGGVHDNYGVMGVTFDSRTGVRLTFGDICNDVQQFINLLEEKLIQEYPDVSYFGKEEYFAKLRQTNAADINWTCDNEGVTIYFNPYLISSFADGILCVTVPFAGNNGLFSEYYTKIPDEYAVPVTQPLDYAFKADGSHKRLLFVSAADKNDEVIPVIIIDGKPFRDDSTAGTELSPLFVHLGGAGEDYLYVFLRRVEYYQLNIYRVTGGNVEKTMEIHGLRRAIDKTDFDFVELCTDPSAMVLEKITNEVDGMYTRGIFRVGAGGAPQLVRWCQ